MWGGEADSPSPPGKCSLNEYIIFQNIKVKVGWAGKYLTARYTGDQMERVKQRLRVERWMEETWRDIGIQVTTGDLP